MFYLDADFIKKLDIVLNWKSTNVQMQSILCCFIHQKH